MTYEQYSPEWLIEHCDNEIAFERAVRRQMSRLLADAKDAHSQRRDAMAAQAETHSELQRVRAQRDELLEALRRVRWCVQADLDSLVETCRHQDGSMEAADAALVATYAEKLGIIDKAIENGGAA